jgi:amino acid transporter
MRQLWVHARALVVSGKRSFHVEEQLLSWFAKSVLFFEILENWGLFGDVWCRGDIVYLAEEMKNPAKDIPHSTIGGISLVAVIYVGPT